uniref:Uncharacterized protein n=1 Tax=Pygoscelis antarcticus TaxID=79643 RepID=A0A7G7LKF0_PYGAN|nr:hypothetical protein [Pygoscelis antarcticus]
MSSIFLTVVSETSKRFAISPVETHFFALLMTSSFLKFGPIRIQIQRPRTSPFVLNFFKFRNNSVKMSRLHMRPPNNLISHINPFAQIQTDSAQDVVQRPLKPTHVSPAF